MATYAQHKAGQAVPIQHSSKAPRDLGVQYGPGGNSGPGSMRAKGKYKQPSKPAPVGGRHGV